MFETQLAPVKEALGSCFGRVLELFSEINVPEHRNELLCFAGIDSYTLSEALADDNGACMRGVEVKYLIEVLGRKNMSAKELCDIFDSQAVPALEQCGAQVKDIKRNACRYSKEQGGYIVSAELVFSAKYETAGVPQFVGFTLGNTAYTCMKRFVIESGVKTSETPLLGGTVKSRIVCSRPTKIKVCGETAFGNSSVYTALRAGLGSAAVNLSVGGIAFAGMAMTALDLESSADGSSKITVEFTEVNDV